MESDENGWLFLEFLADQHFEKVLGVCLAHQLGIAYSSLKGEGEICANQKSVRAFPVEVATWWPQDSHQLLSPGFEARDSRRIRFLNVSVQLSQSYHCSSGPQYQPVLSAW